MFFLPHYGGQLKTTVEQEAGEKLDCKKIITKWKINKNFKMPSCCAVFNCSNRADRKKDKSNYPFPPIFKNNGKESLKLSKVRFWYDENKTRIENWLPVDFELGSLWMRIYSHNNQTIFNSLWWGVLNFYIRIIKVLEQSWRPFTSLKLCKGSQISHPASRVASNTNKIQPPFAWSSKNTPHTLNYATPLIAV